MKRRNRPAPGDRQARMLPPADPHPLKSTRAAQSAGWLLEVIARRIHRDKVAPGALHAAAATAVMRAKFTADAIDRVRK